MARKAKHAKQFSKTKGPKSTTPCHGKKKAWFQLKDHTGRLLCMQNKTKKGAGSSAEA
jgi:hypothetical protein